MQSLEYRKNDSESHYLIKFEQNDYSLKDLDLNELNRKINKIMKEPINHDSPPLFIPFKD